MKKGVVVVLILLAVIVLVSPAIVGRLAEKSMDDSLNWAAEESGEVRITSEHYDRGWFSSEGQHRIELLDGELRTTLQSLAGPMDASEVPVLVINTRLDHGLIPVASMSREKGSLAPGLGSAVSTLQLEMPGGEMIDLPGTIYSKVALGGELQSNYIAEPGSHVGGNMSATWGATNIDVTTNPRNGRVLFKGDVGPLLLSGANDSIGLASLSFDGDQQPTKYGFAVGDIEFALEDLSIMAGGVEAGGLREMAVTADSQIDNGDLDADATINMVLSDLPQFGEMSYDMELTIRGADAEALGRMQGRLQSVASTQDPGALYAAVESDAKQLFASGFALNFERFNLTLPQGTVSSVMSFNFGEEDPATFEWTTLLLSTEAAIDLSIPESLVEMIVQTNPEVGMAIAGGYLVKDGNAYVMEAELKKGLLTVNGAPIPIPLGSMF